jgi:ligand-binding SRPBCC domain-containing protein
MIEIKKHSEKGYVLTTSQLIRRDRDEVFAFFSDACQLENITPPFLKFKILTPRPIELKKGALIDYSIRLRVVPITWRTEISEWEPPFRFADRQLNGPYKQWIHEHTFESVPEGTLVRDRVHYICPGGPFSPLVHALFVKRDVVNIFKYRQKRLDEILNESAESYEIGSLAVG